MDSGNHAPPIPLLSDLILIFFNSPNETLETVNTSTDPLSKLFCASANVTNN